MRVPLLVLIAVLALAACSAGDGATADDATSSPTGPRVGEGLRLERVVSGLEGPTQMTFGPDGRLWVAQLAGGENAGQGEVVAVDLADGSTEVVLSDLDKPTGLALLADSWWIQTPDALLRADAVAPSRPEPVVSDLLNNGRSNGTLTPTPDGTLLYETSGRERDGSGVEGSGVLWELDPAEQPASPRAVASGLKNAYAHVVDDGVLWATEVAESIGGVTAADELVRVREGADYGWPACVGDRVPVPAFGGDERRCADTAPPAVTFPAGATPTSVVANPFGEGLLVALWNTGEVVVVTPDAAAATETAAASTVLVDGLPRPQHLLVDDGTLLVSDHELGAVWRITADDA